MQDYRIQLDTYSGPMELLLYLIRRDEVDIYDIPIARILEQYLRYVRLLEVLDPEVVGDFLVMAATLMEIKSRMLLPKPPPEENDGEDLLDPRADLVRQLLAYRAFREAAGELGRRAETHANRFGRPPVELPEQDGAVDLDNVQVWDLLAAFNKLMASVGVQRAFHEVKYDDTPITLHAVDIQDRLVRDGPSMVFEAVFEGRTRSQMIGLFLALLELIRQRRVRIEQADSCGPILVHLIDATPITAVDDVKAGGDEDANDALDDAEDAALADVREDDSPELAESPVSDEDFEPAAEDNEPAAENDEPAEAMRSDQSMRSVSRLDELDDESDEYLRRLDAIHVGEIDLGRDRVADEPPRDEASEEVRPADFGSMAESNNSGAEEESAHGSS